jgi:hypothetical protein
MTLGTTCDEEIGYFADPPTNPQLRNEAVDCRFDSMFR